MTCVIGSVYSKISLVGSLHFWYVIVNTPQTRSSSRDGFPVQAKEGLAHAYREDMSSPFRNASCVT